MPDKDWLSKARNALATSTSYVDANYRSQWENNLRAFQSRHHSTSKYLSAAYRWRSRTYRPKSRSAVRNNEAAAAAAFFTNNDVVSIEAMDPSDKLQRASAALMQQLIQYRLTTSIPWFLTLVGGFQDTQVVGVVASYQSWKFREIEVDEELSFGEGNETSVQKVRKVVEDRPSVELIPVENIRIHPAADWADPVNSSPYLLRLIPMYVIDIKSKMDPLNVKDNQQPWISLSDDELKSGTNQNFDPTRLTREDGREDKTDNKGSISDYDIVWVIENFMRDSDFVDKVFYTLGSDYLLTNPVPIQEVYFTGKRPIAMGIAVIETHKIFPSSSIQLGENIQREINDVTNSRLDNVKLVLNKRYLVKRGAQVDLKSITRNVAGSITFVSDIDDVKPFDFNDVTSSSYEEQNRLSTEYDELVGNFSQSSVASNRKLNETVGGMQMLRAGAYGLTEYIIRTFAETWVKEVVFQLIALEQKYESDMTILTLAKNKAQLFQKFGVDEITDELLNQRLTMEINVGIGATDPITKLNQFILAMKHLTEILKQPPPGINMEEVQKEIFGRLGHKDGQRFFSSDDDSTANEQRLKAIVQQLEQEIARLTEELEGKDRDNLAKVAITQMKETAQNQRHSSELENQIVLETIKLQNPVQGEKID